MPLIQSFRPCLEWLEDRRVPATFFVANGGSDIGNDGSIAQPFASIQHALDLATNPGDIVEVRGGTYNEAVTFRASGSEFGHITLRAYNGEQAILDGTGLDATHLIQARNRSYIKIVGLEVMNLTVDDGGSGIHIIGQGGHIEIRDNIVHEMRGFEASGIDVYGIRDKPLTSIIIDGNQVFDCDAADSEALVVNGNVQGFEITDNQVHDVNNIGIVCIGGERDVHATKVARRGLVRGNQVWNCHSNYGGGYAGGIYVDGGKNIVVEQNVSFSNDLGIEIGAENRGFVARNVTVRNNLIYDNEKSGLVFGGYAFRRGRVQDCRFYNNTLYRNDQLHQNEGQIAINWASDNIVTNNIVVGDAGDLLIASYSQGNQRNLFNNNLYFTADGSASARFSFRGQEFTGFAAYQAVTGKDKASLFGDPAFVDVVTFDFHLTAGSPARDAGRAVAGQFAAGDFDGTPRDTQPDIGAFEFVV
jgi:hypothetical protein